MATMVTDADQRRPPNRYPHRIISLPRPSPCCFAAMKEVGTPQTDGRGACRRLWVPVVPGCLDA